MGQKAVDLDAIMVSEAYNSSAPIYPCQSGWSNWSWDAGTRTMVGSYNGSQPSFPPQAPPPPAPASTYDRAKLTLSGQATLERQAFLATLELDSITASDLLSVTVDIQAVDDNGVVAGGFLITPTVPTLLGTLAGNDSLAGQWTIVPGDLGITDPNGATYAVSAEITYLQGGVVQTTTTVPEQITVYPQPRVRLTTSHSQPDANGDFYIEVKAQNNGYGVARNLTLDLSQVSVTGIDGAGTSLQFSLQATTIDGVAQPATYVFNFGDIAPDEVKTGRWQLKVTSSTGLALQNAQITGFSLNCSHRDYQGLQIPALIADCGEAIQYFLTGECPFCGNDDKYKIVGSGLNTANGNYTYRQSTPALLTLAEPLRLEWIYNSLTSGAHPDLPASGSVLGLGWTHTYNASLDLSGGNSVVFKAPHGTPLNFERIKGEYRPAPGIRATLTRTQVITDQYLYTVTAANQSRYIFADDGKLLRQLDPPGNATELTYDAQNRLTAVTEPVSGRALTLSYDAQDRLITVTDPASRTTRFGYDASSRLTTVTDTRNQTWSYTYTQNSLQPSIFILSKVTDPDGRIVEQTGFDDLGRAISQTWRGESVSVVYHDDGRRTITDGLGRVLTHTYNSQLLLVGVTDAAGQAESYTLDTDYNRTHSRDKNGNLTHYARTSMGLTTAVTDALGQTTQFEYDDHNNLTRSIDALGRATTYAYDAQNNVISTTNALGYSTRYTYNAQGQQTSVTDENGNTTRYGYDTLSQRTVITDALRSAPNGVGYASYTEYDDLGRVVRTIDAKGKVTLNEYDGGDNLIRVTENYRADKGPNEDDEYNIITEYTYDGAGRRLTTTDTLGRVSRSVYDDAGRLLRTIQNEHPTETAQNYLNEYNLTTEYVYDAAGNQIATIDTLGRESRTEYDDLNRVSRTIVNYVDGSYDPASPDEDIVTEFVYDANGNLLETIDVLGRRTRTGYDDLNRVERTIVNYVDGVYDSASPDEDLITVYTYDEAGNQKTITDPLGRVTTYNYDDLNRVASITNPLGDATTYSYDPAGNRISVTDAEGRTTHYQYDELNRVAVTTNPISGTTSVTFDEVGNRLTATDANGHTTSFTYDSLYRVISTTDAENQTTSTSYNASGNRQSVTDAEGNTIIFSYDSLNRVIQTTNPLSGTTGVTYDALGNRLTNTDANHHTTTFTYDRLNRVTRTTNPLNQTSATVYDGLGNRLSQTNGAGETTTFVYDEVNRLIQIQNQKSEIQNYRYDGVGNRTAQIDAEGIETRYSYDDLGRLTGVIENYVDGVYSAGVTDEDVITQYSYDKVGNRLSVTDANGHTTTYVYDDLNRRVKLRDPLNNTTGYGYDAVGNRTSLLDANGETTTFVYDDVNRLTTIDYSDDTPDVTFTYDNAGNRLSMADGSGTTTYTYDDLYRLTGLEDGAGLPVGYGYDAAGNRTQLTYPDGREVTYAYDDGNRLQTVEDWHNGQFGYNYDNANRLTGLTLPNGIASNYSYDNAGRLLVLTHDTLTDTLASYSYSLDKVGNRTALTETLVAVLNVPAGAWLEQTGQVVIEAEHAQRSNGQSHNWLLKTSLPGYTGTSYLQSSPDIDALVQTAEITASPKAEYAVNFTTPATYTLWLRGYPANTAGDSVYVTLGDETVGVTGFVPGKWGWGNSSLPGGAAAQLAVQAPGVYTLSLHMREDGLRIDRLLLTTDTTYVPLDTGPTETVRQTASSGLLTVIDHTIDYDYDRLYRLTGANYTTGQSYAYEYDPVGNRLQQIINGDTTAYLYDAANRLAQLNGQAVYSFDANGNLLGSDVLTNTWDAANRLVAAEREGTTMQPLYNGVNDRVGQTVGITTTHFALDVQGLPEVIYTSEGESYLHLPGVIMTESNSGEVRYLLSDGLGSVRQAVDETAQVVSYYEFDPYGNPVNNNGGDPYGYTGEWYGGYTHLLHLRARWYAPETGAFLSVDPVESEPPYQYVRGNVVNLTDSSGKEPPFPLECLDAPDPMMCWGASMWQTGELLTFEKYHNYAEIVEAINHSKNTQRDDGIIFGMAAGAGASPLAVVGLLSTLGDITNTFGWFSFNDCSLPVTGYTGGIEIVYDFKHQERGLFHYHGPAFNGLTGINIGGSGYIGKTRGFDNPNYRDGVMAYRGYFLGFNMSGNEPTTGLSGIYIEAAPLDEKGVLNTSGVFATYYAIARGEGVSSPINLEVAKTYYDNNMFNWMPDSFIRERYLFGNDESKKHDTAYREDVAFRMASEITRLTNSDIFPGPVSAFVNQAITELFSFVDNP